MGKPAAYYTELFARLGGLLEGFGTVPETRAVAEAAVAANPWFTLSDVVFSVDAVRRNMLDAAVSARWLSYYGANERTVRSRGGHHGGEYPVGGVVRPVVCRGFGLYSVH